MNRNDNTTRPEVEDEVIELGVASVETKGGEGSTEGIGVFALPGISEK